MIFNPREVIKVLQKLQYDAALNHKELQCIRTLIVYLDNEEPKLTFEEFQALFDCTPNYIDEYTLRIDVTPKTKCYMRVQKSKSGIRASNSTAEICPEIKEHLEYAAYSEFLKAIKGLECK